MSSGRGINTTNNVLYWRTARRWAVSGRHACRLQLIRRATPGSSTPVQIGSQSYAVNYTGSGNVFVSLGAIYAFNSLSFLPTAPGPKLI